MIGERIRAIRQRLGLSQQQLAGDEMTRVFISLVESGKTKPSPAKLRIIAQRLGKPIEYFLNGELEEGELDSIITQLQTVQAQLEQELPAEQLARIEDELRSLLKRVAGVPRCLDVEAQARWLLVQCLRLQGYSEECLEECERVLACFQQLKDLPGVTRTYKEIGDIALTQQNFVMAQKAYRQAALYAHGIKGMQTLRIQVSVYLGSTLYQMGNLEEAQASYREALAECQTVDAPELEAYAAMGLGMACYNARDLSSAKQWTSKAIELLQRIHHSNMVLAKHNLAVIEAAHGNWERSYILLRECIQIYQEQGRIVKLTSAMEDLARYWQQKGDYPKAEQICWEALDLLDTEDDPLLRGCLYRRLGTLAEAQGNYNQAQALFRTSFDLLRQIKAALEADTTAKEFQRFKEALRG